MEDIHRAYDDLFYATFPDARPSPRSREAEAAHAALYAPPELQAALPRLARKPTPVPLPPSPQHLALKHPNPSAQGTDAQTQTHAAPRPPGREYDFADPAAHYAYYGPPLQLTAQHFAPSLAPSLALALPPAGPVALPGPAPAPGAAVAGGHTAPRRPALTLAHSFSPLSASTSTSLSPLGPLRGGAGEDATPPPPSAVSTRSRSASGSVSPSPPPTKRPKREPGVASAATSTSSSAAAATSTSAKKKRPPPSSSSAPNTSSLTPNTSSKDKPKPKKHDTPRGEQHKKPPLACLFCRGRKIACGPAVGVPLPVVQGGGASASAFVRSSSCPSSALLPPSFLLPLPSFLSPPSSFARASARPPVRPSARPSVRASGRALARCSPIHPSIRVLPPSVPGPSLPFLPFVFC
ncbi:hypothetical protein B0H15DRAFT_186993 [Mycena belliarum]|uniref:Uncharacterized protein n=1 Tax=Mycena belliarum TaxID=1033014 RepID=A0AAD6XNW9_9AGAR|nr:hypothetical protein B0H15DRAFT_186993 [Mycena belliae]